MIVVNATINGQGPFRFVLDTGSSVNSIKPELAQTLGLKVEGGAVVDTGGRAKGSAGLVRAAELQIGDFKLAGQSFFVAPFPVAYPFQGFLGADIFKRFIVRIDFQHSLLTLTIPSAYHRAGTGVVLPIKFYDGLIPQIKAKVDGNAGWFKLDTGYNGSLTLFKKFIDERGLWLKYEPQRSDTGVRTLTEEFSNMPVAHIHELKLGNIALSNVLTAFFNESEGSNTIFAGAIGTGVLKQFNVIIDYEQKRVILESR